MTLVFDGVRGLDLQCSFSGNVCSVSSLQVTSPNQNVITVNGQNESFYRTRSVKKLSIGDKNINFMPNGIEKFFPDLESIRICNSNLKSIDQADLKPFGKLRNLDVERNDLVFLDSELFEFNPEIETLDFYNNKLRYVGENIFKSLSKLNIADFNNNPCSSYRMNSKIQLAVLISELNSNCQVPKFYSDLKLKMEANLKIDDGLLNAATKNLYLTKKKLNSSEKLTINQTELEQIDLQCETVDSSEVCEAVNLKISFVGSAIGKVKSKNGSTMSGLMVKNLMISKQQTLFLPHNLVEHFPNLKTFVASSSGLFEIGTSTSRNSPHCWN